MLRKLVISFPVFGFAVLQLPVAAFFICVILSIVRNFDEANFTHCRVYNFLPSLSAAVGGFEPQIAIWKYAIVLHTLPRVFIAILYLQLNFRLKRTPFSQSSVHYRVDKTAKYNEESCNPFDCPAEMDDYSTYGNVSMAHRFRRERGEHESPFGECSCLPLAAFICNLVELIALCRLSLVPSRENFEAHKQAFGFFVVFGFLYMLLTLIVHAQRRVFSTKADACSFRYKKWTFAAYVSCFLLAAYFYVRHNRYCEPFIYSYFALSEYGGVMTNVAFHATAILDFRAKRLVIADWTDSAPPSRRFVPSRSDSWPRPERDAAGTGQTAHTNSTAYTAYAFNVEQPSEAQHQAKNVVRISFALNGSAHDSITPMT